MEKKKRKRGFTLIEILIVIGLIALLASTVLVAVNPARQFKFARDTERKAHLSTILNALGQNLAENQGSLKCDGSLATLPATYKEIKSGSSTTSFDLGPCLVPEYLAKMPFDPGYVGAGFVSEADYDTGYSILQDTEGHISVSSKSEMTPLTDIVLTR